MNNIVKNLSYVIVRPGVLRETRGMGDSPEHTKTTRAILVVDDETSVLKVISRLFTRLGDIVISASSGSEALRAVTLDSRALDVMIVDHTMPDMCGTECVEAVRKIHPEVPVLLMSGGKFYEALPDRSKFIAKPFSAEELLKAVNSLTQIDAF